MLDAVTSRHEEVVTELRALREELQGALQGAEYVPPEPEAEPWESKNSNVNTGRIPDGYRKP